MDQLLQSGWNQTLTSPLSSGSPQSAAEWVDDRAACKEEGVSSDKRQSLDEGGRLTANLTKLCQTRHRTGVAAALFSCGPSRHQYYVRIESEDDSKNVPPCLRHFDCLDPSSLWVTTTLPVFRRFKPTAALMIPHAVGPSRLMMKLKWWWLHTCLWLRKVH